MKGRKYKGRRRDVVDDGICQNQRIAKSVSCLSSAPLGLFKYASIGLGLYLSVAKIFYLYLINWQLNFCPISNSAPLI